jgi:hypothetical protein
MSHPHEHASSSGATAPGFQAPVALDGYLQSSHSHSSSDSSHSQSRSQAPSTQQYTYLPPTSSPAQLAAPIKFVDSNPRPSKSPRHVAPPERQLSLPESSYPDYNSARFTGPYHNNPSDVLPPRDPAYFPQPLSLQQQQTSQPWTSTSDSSGVYGTTIQAPSTQTNHYQFPPEPYVKPEENNHPQPQPSYAWTAS